VHCDICGVKKVVNFQNFSRRIILRVSINDGSKIWCRSCNAKRLEEQGKAKKERRAHHLICTGTLEDGVTVCPKCHGFGLGKLLK